MQQKTFELIAFIAVLATGIMLIALGVAPESLAAVTIALAGLYLAWRTGHSGQNPPGKE